MKAWLQNFLTCFAKTPSGETIGTLRSCRDHWKISFEHERANVIRLREMVYNIHQSGLSGRCACRDCALVRQSVEAEPA